MFTAARWVIILSLAYLYATLMDDTFGDAYVSFPSWVRTCAMLGHGMVGSLILWFFFHLTDPQKRRAPRDHRLSGTDN